METAEIIETSHGQLIQLPGEFRIAAKQVVLRRQGESIILEPVKPDTWPPGFFEAVAIDDPAFARPDQGTMPPAPELE